MGSNRKRVDQEEEIQLFEGDMKKLGEQPDPQKITSEDVLEEQLAQGRQSISVLPAVRILVRR